MEKPKFHANHFHVERSTHTFFPSNIYFFCFELTARASYLYEYNYTLSCYPLSVSFEPPRERTEFVYTKAIKRKHRGNDDWQTNKFFTKARKSRSRNEFGKFCTPQMKGIHARSRNLLKFHGQKPRWRWLFSRE